MEKPEPDGIEKSIGAFGRWQFAVCVILYSLKLPIAWHQLNIVIIAPPTKNFTCVNNPDDKCAPNCKGHIFDRSIFTETIIMTWDLVCDREYLTRVLQSLTMLGILTGNFIGGFIADRWGRKVVLIIAIVVQIISGSVAAIVPWLWLFMIVKFINAASTGGTMLTSFVIIMEIIGIKWRTIACCLFQIPFCIGHATLAPIAYFIRDWRYLQLACSLPISIVIAFVWLIPESPRWLISVGKRDKAIHVLERGAKFNGLPIEDIPNHVDKYINERISKARKGGNIRDLFAAKQLRCKFILILLAWFNCGFGYFGVAEVAGYLQGDYFLNIAAAGSSGIPGMIAAVIFMQTVGRKPSLLMGNLFSGLGMLILTPFIDHHIAAAACTSISIFGLSMSFSTVYTFCGELSPTIVRNVSIGMASVVARIGSMVAPFVMLLAHTDINWVVPIIFGSIAFTAMVLGLWLPETKDCILPDTIEDSDHYKVTIKFKRIDPYDFDLFFILMQSSR